MNTETTNMQKLLRAIVLLTVLTTAVLAFCPAVSAADAGDSYGTKITYSLYSVTLTADNTVASAGYTVQTKEGETPVPIYSDTYTAFIGKNGKVLIKVNSLPDGYTLKVTTSVPDKTTTLNNDVLIKNITANVTISLSAEEIGPHTVTFNANGGSPQPEVQYVEEGKCAVKPTPDPFKSGYTFDAWYLGNAKYDFSTPVREDLTLVARYTQNPSPSPSGGGGASVWGPPINPPPQQPVAAEVTAQYTGVPFIGTTAANLSAIEVADKAYAAEIELRLAAAKEAGLPLVNSRGAPAIVVLKGEKPGVETEHFVRVYDIKPAVAGEMLTEVEIAVPMADIASSGLTYEDVNIYHCIEEMELWVPLEIVKVTFDAENYYFTAKTEGASPFGVLIKHFEPAGPDVRPLPTPVPKTAVPLAGLLAGLGAAGLGAAGILPGLKRK